MFKGNKPLTKLFGTIGIPLAVFVHGYTGFILALGKARALWNTALMLSSSWFRRWFRESPS